ncbi:MAG: DNA methyltransferase, partial [Pseudanabaenaceae cyanobacterium]
RLLLARELLADSGSVFVQISDENVHHVRELMDEVFGDKNFIGIVTLKKTHHQESRLLPLVADYIIWYARDKNYVKFRNYYQLKTLTDVDYNKYRKLEESNGIIRLLTSEERNNPDLIPIGCRPFRDDITLTQDGESSDGQIPFEFNGETFYPGRGRHWRTSIEGLKKLAQKNRISAGNNRPFFKAFWDDLPFSQMNNIWSDLAGAQDKLYVVQTNEKAIQRCILMTTDPGDLVMDITCGGGTTAYVAEQWGRRWITCDVSRVPIALARQRLLTATFPWYELKNGKSPANGFVYQRKQNSKGEEIGGIVPHLELKNIANNEPPKMETLVDRPETDSNIVRVCSPFTIEGTIPPPADMALEPTIPEPPETEPDFSFTGKMLEVLRQSPILRLPQNQTVTFQNLRQLTKSQHLTATATVDGQPVVFIFGPENGAIAERSVYEAAQEAKNQYQHLYVIGFAIVAKARQFVEHCHETIGIPATYIQATPDLLMGDLLKNMRSSQIFSVCGLPDITITPLANNEYTVELLGLDVFDPVTMQASHQKGKDIPAWFLDTDYNGLCFYVRQAFFPRTSAWDSLKKALKGSYEDSVWDHLSGTTSAPFTPGENREIAVKVIDDRGNELLVVKELPK